MNVLLIAAAAYFLLMRAGGLPSPTAAPMRAPARTATGTFTPNATRITIPGVGDYLNIPGQGVAITIDPNFYGNLFPSTPTPEIAQASAFPDYQAADVTSPVDPYFYTALPVL